METAQQIEPSATTWSGEEGATTRYPTVPAQPASSPLLVRWLAVASLVQLGALGAMGWLLYSLRADVDAVKQATAAQHEAAVQQIAALGDETKDLGTRVQDVRELIASNTAEDVIFLKMMVLKPSIDPELARTIASSIHHHAQQYGRDPDLVLSIMAVESNFDPNVVSYAGATGLMQVMPHWKQVLGIREDLKDPDTSVKTGLQILAFYEQMYKDLELALTAYNRGPGPVDMALVKGRDPKNAYAPRVLSVYEKLKKLRAGTTRKSERI